MPRSPKKKSDEEVKPDQKPYVKDKPQASPKKAARGWTKEEKEIILMTVIESAQVDWNVVAGKLEGRTAMQAKDQWRQTLLPAIKKNDAIFGVRGA